MYRQDAKHDRTLQEGCGRGHGWCIAKAMNGAINVVQEESRKSVTGTKESSGSVLSVHAGFLQLSPEDSVSVEMDSTDYEGLSRWLGRSNGKSVLSVSADEGAERFLDFTTERSDLLLRLKDFKVSEENLER